MKERNETQPKNPKKNERYLDTLKQEKEQTKEDVEKIRPILEKDPDWNLVSGKKDWDNSEEHDRQKRSVVRLTKKAVNLLFPEYKVKVSRDRGSASAWVNVNFVIPEVESLEHQAITGRTQRLLKSVGIQYASYYSDSLPGKDDWRPCILVAVNHIN